MIENIRESLKNIKRLINLFFVFIGLLFAVGINFLSSGPSSTKINLPYLNIEIHSGIFSLVIGILFGIFIILLFLNLRLFKILINQIDFDRNNDYSGMIDSIKFSPGVANPFHKSKMGLIILASAILLGCAYLGYLGYNHITMVGFSENANVPSFAYQVSSFTYQVIGWVDVFILIVSVVLCAFISKYILYIRNKLQL